MSDTGLIDVKADGANKYGCQPCPECGSTSRWSCEEIKILRSLVIACDCGFKEPGTQAEVPF